jgi:TANFOR domain-containing protein
MTTYVKILTAIAMLFFCSNLFAQSINITLTVVPPYPIYLENYINRGNSVIITVTNISSETKEIRLLPEVTGNNGVSGKVKLSFQPNAPIVLNPMQTRTFTFNQLQTFNGNITENDVQYQGIDVATIVQNEALPEGNYTVCVRAYAFNSNELLSNEFAGCTNVNITNYDPPIIVYPSDNQTLLPINPQIVNFVWTPAGIPGKTRYKFRMVDMTANNLFNINDAFNNPAVQTYYERDNLQTTTLSYNQSAPPLIKGRKYALMLIAYDPTKTIQFKNSGRSPVTAFVYGNEENAQGDDNNADVPDDEVVVIPQDDLPDNVPPNPVPQDPTDDPSCKASCNVSQPQATTPLNLVQGQEVIVGKFKMKITKITGQNTGEGSIFVAFLNTPVKVKFANIKVNSEGKLFEGNVFASIDNQSLISQAIAENPNPDLQSLAQKTAQINNFIKQNSRMVSKLAGENSAPLGLPFNLDQNAYNLAIVGIIFSPTEAKMHTVLGIELPQIVGNENFALSGVGLGIRPNGFCADVSGKLTLANDMTLKMSNDLNLIFEKNATFAEFDCKGINKVALKGALEWSRSKLTPYQNDKVVEGENNKLRATFQTQLLNANDWVFASQFNYPAFVLSSAQNLIFSAPALTLDLSPTQTPNLVMQKYNVGNDWAGIYIENINLTLPEVFRKKNNPLVLSAKDFMADKNGISGQFALQGDLLNLQDGNLDSWGIALSKFGLTLKNSAVSGGTFEGKIQIPVTDEPLDYAGTLVQAQGQGEANFSFAVKTNEDYSANAWIATLSLQQDSKIKIEKKAGKWGVDLDLNGLISIAWDAQKADSDEMKNANSVSSFNLPQIRFENMRLKSDGAKGLKDFMVSKLSMENLNLPQIQLASFPLSLDKNKPIAFVSKTIEGKQAFGFELSPEISLMEAANGFKGKATFAVYAAYSDNKKRLAFHKTELSSIAIDANIGVASMKGSVNIYKQDATFGNGFKGKIEVDVPAGAKVKATLQVGKTLEKGNEEGYRYWYFDAMVKVAAGIQLGSTPVALYGFAGGAWYNMTRGNVAAVAYGDFSDKTDAPADLTPGASESGVSFTPEKNKIGFKAAVIFGLSGGIQAATALNGDVGFEVYMKKDNHTGLKLDSLILVGNAYIMQAVEMPMGEKANAAVKAFIRIKADAVKPAFNLAAGVSIKVGEFIKGNGTLECHFEKDKWYIYMGQWSQQQAHQDEPWNDPKRINLTVKLVTQTTFYGYFMMGSQIPTYLPSMPKKVRDALNLPLQQTPQFASAQSGAGFGLGLGFYKGFNAKFLFLYADFELFAGMDMVLNKFGDDVLCNGKSKFGINKWRAKGQAYAYFGGDAGFEGKIFGKVRKWSLINLTAAAAIEVEAPNPTFVAGAFAVKGSLLGGAIKINLKFKFEAGEKCEYSGGSDNPFDDYPLITDMLPTNNAKNQSVMTDPQVAFNLRIRNGLTGAQFFPNNVFEMAKSDNPDEQNNTALVYVKVEKAELYYSDNGKKTLAVGDFKLNNSQNEGYFSAKNALEPNTTYTFLVEVSGWEIKDGVHTKLATQSKQVSFTTGKGLTSIPQSEIVYAEPFARERFVERKERWGRIELAKSVCGQPLFEKLPPSKGSTKFIARFTELETGKVTDTENVNCADDNVNFKVPQLNANMLYEISIIRVDVPLNNNFAVATTSTSEKSYTGATAYYTALKNSRSSEKKLETKLITYHFRTGKFNSASEKLAAMKIKQVDIGTMPVEKATENGNDFIEVAVLALESDEAIDVYNAFGYQKEGRMLGSGTNITLNPPVTGGYVLVSGDIGVNDNPFPKNYRAEFFNRANLQAKYKAGILQLIPASFDSYRFFGMTNFGSNKTVADPYLTSERLNNVMFYRPTTQSVYGKNGVGSFKPNGITYTMPWHLLTPAEIQAAKAKAPQVNVNQGGLNILAPQQSPPGNQFGNFNMASNTKFYIPIIEYGAYLTAKDRVASAKFTQEQVGKIHIAQALLSPNGLNGTKMNDVNNYFVNFVPPSYQNGTYLITIDGKKMTYQISK